jgi:large subunit ribosomal protein L29
MKATDLRERTTEDLLDLEHSLSLDRFQNRFKNFTNRLDDTSVIRKTRRDLARVKLILLERAHGAAPQKAEPKPVKAAKPAQAKPAVVEAPKAEKAQKIEKTEKTEKAQKTEKKAAKVAAADKPKKAAEPKAAKPAAKKAKPAKSEESK